MAVNKCKNCGYRFKRDDGAICPECLTSREDTMDCEDFSSDLHSHEEGFLGQREEMSDAQKQLEQERFLNAVDKAKRSGNSQRFGSRSTTFNPKTSMGNYSYTKTTTHNGRTSTFHTFSTTNIPSNIPNFKAKIEKNRKIAKMIGIIIVVMVLINIFVPIIFGIVFQNAFHDDDDYTYENTEYSQTSFFETEIYTDDYTIAFYQPSVVDYEPTDVDEKFLSGEYQLIQVPVLVKSKMGDEISSRDILDELEIYYLTDDANFEECEKLDNANLEFGITSYQTAYYSDFFMVKKSDSYRLVFNDYSYGDIIHYTIDFELVYEQNAKEDI